MRLLCVSCFVLLILVPSVSMATCDKDAIVCEFWLEIDMRLTMMDGFDAVYPRKGKLYRYNVTEESVDAGTATPVDETNVISADGWETQRLVIVANGTMPGPVIEVYEGQDVIVYVMNKLASESTTIHWHGLHQVNSPWMDGVAYISQCPIGPGQTFAYRFKASPKGSFIYHAHIGAQRTMGLYGPLIVRDNKSQAIKEFFAITSDWNHDWDSNVSYLKMIQGIYVNRQPYKTTESLDGGQFSRFRFDSGLINGKGRYYNPPNGNNGAPLEVFNVKKGRMYRFRWANAGNIYPFRISVDNHYITVVASDGYDVDPFPCDAFIVNPGERFDFTVLADQPIRNYWIRAVTLEVGQNHRTEAILRYDGAPTVDPTSTEQVCLPNDRCIVVNCPFSYYPAENLTDCVTFDQLKSIDIQDPSVTSKATEVEERFLNFAFPGTTVTPGSVNGKVFTSPTVSAITQPLQLENFKCGDDCGEQKICECMHSLDMEHGKIYQLVFTNMGKGRGWSHPVHMHGHAFYVMKMGYGQYNNSTGQIIGDNMDVDCRGGVERSESFCNDAGWTNPASSGINVPNMELQYPPRKDTIIVPTGGYVVIRIKADNPGVWYMHCHIELHNHNGMGMILNESYPEHPKPPDGFPKCGDYISTTGSGTTSGQGGTYVSSVFWIVSLLVVVLRIDLVK